MWTDTVQKQIGLKKGIAKLPHWVSDFFLFFFRKDGVRNFFFFFEGDLFGDSSLPWSPAASSPATGSSPSCWGAESVSSGAGSSAGRAAASEASSGVRSGRVCLKVAASLSSLNVCSWCASVEDEEKRSQWVCRSAHGMDTVQGEIQHSTIRLLIYEAWK